jgi:hypothetical protein
VILAVAAFASIVLADPNFRRPIYHSIRYPGRYYGRLYGRQVDPTAANSAKDITAAVPVAARPVPRTPLQLYP